MSVDRMVKPNNQVRYIDPYQVRVFQYDTPSSDVFLSRVVNSVYHIFGNDICINGFEYNKYHLTHTDEDIIIRVPEGMLIQDTTLLDVNQDTTISLENLSGLNVNGKIVVYIRYQFLLNIDEPTSLYICANYISANGTSRVGWNHDTDRTVLGIIEFTKDSSDRVSAVFLSGDRYIDIEGKRYWLYGFDPSKKELTTYLLKMVYKDTGSSICIQDGLSLCGDAEEPGILKYYGTDEEADRGWYDLPGGEIRPETNFTQLADVPHTYSNNSGKIVRVKINQSGLEFISIPNLDQLVTLYDDQTLICNKIFDGDVWILGDCNIRGNVTYVNREDLNITNNEISLNVGEPGVGISLIYAGLRVKRGTLPDALLRYNEVTDRWEVGFEGSQKQGLVTDDMLWKIKDKGEITEYKNVIYDFKLINGNLILSSPEA